MAAKSASAILATPAMSMRRQMQAQPRGSGIGAIPTPGGGMGGYKMGLPGGMGMGPINPMAKPMMGQAPPQWAAQPPRPMLGGVKPMGGVASPFGMGGAGIGGGMTIASPLTTGAGAGATGAPGSAAMPAPPTSPAAGGMTTAASTAAPPTGFTGGAPGQAAQGGSSGPLDPWGYPTQAPLGPKVGRKGKKKFGGHGYSQKAYRKLPPWLLNAQDPMFGTALGSIQDILNSGGKMSPERMIQEQADIEAGRGQGQQALQARLAAAGVDPSSPMYQSMAGTVDQSANRMQVENRRAEDIRAEMQKRQDLNLVMPYLQAILGLTTKHGGGGVQAAPVGGGGGGNPDYMGALSNIAGSVLGGWAQSGFQT